MNYSLSNPGMKLYIKSMGKIFRVTAICKTNEDANEVCEKHPEVAVMACDKQGLVFVAKRYEAICTSDKIIDD